MPADRPQPHDERDGLHHRGGVRVPERQRHIPFECATLAEVLGERGWNTYMVGKWHLCRRGRDEPGVDQAPVAARARLRALLRLPRRRDQPVVSRPRVRQPPGRAAGDARGGLPLHDDITDKALEFIRDAKAVAPDKPFFLYYCPGAAPRPAPRAEGVDRTSTRASSTWATRRTASWSSQRQKQMGILPEHAELSPINPYIDRHQHGRQALARARHGPSLGLPDRRREAAVRAHGRGLRRLPQPRRPRDRPAARLPGGDRPARQHA